MIGRAARTTGPGAPTAHAALYAGVATSRRAHLTSVVAGTEAVAGVSVGQWKGWCG